MMVHRIVIVRGSIQNPEAKKDTSVNFQSQSGLIVQKWWNPAFRISLNPSKVEHLTVDEMQTIYINCTNEENIADNDNLAMSDATDVVDTVDPKHSIHTKVNYSTIPNNNSLSPTLAHQHQPLPYYIAMITSINPQVAIPTGDYDKIFKLNENRTDQILTRFQPDEGSAFLVHAMHVGYGAMRVQVFTQWGNSDALGDDPLYWNLSRPIYELYISVSVVRRLRWVDMTFDCVIAAMATLTAFSIGCDSDWSGLLKHIRTPATLLMTMACQFVINPLVSIRRVPKTACISSRE